MKKFIKLEIILIIFLFTIQLISCTNKNKKVTVSNDIEKESFVEEKQVTELITNGKKLLLEDKFIEAKINFIKAISLDKNNKNIYLEIKDSYLNVNRLDDAYYIIKVALLNDVDKEYMENILNDISNNFDLINLSATVTQNSTYTLPNDINLEINNNTVSLPIFWTNSIVDTSELGSFKYEGVNKEFGRKVVMNILVSSNDYTTKYGYLKNVSMKDNKIYADFDLVDAYFYDKALEEAIKDNKATKNEYGEYVYDNPYIRNVSDKITSYELNTNFAYTKYYSEVVPFNDSMIYQSKQEVINYEDLYSFYTNSEKSKFDNKLLKIYIKNNLIYSFTPDNFYY